MPPLVRKVFLALFDDPYKGTLTLKGFAVDWLGRVAPYIDGVSLQSYFTLYVNLTRRGFPDLANEIHAYIFDQTKAEFEEFKARMIAAED